MLWKELYVERKIVKILLKVKYRKSKLINAAIKIYYFCLLLLDDHVAILHSFS